MWRVIVCRSRSLPHRARARAAPDRGRRRASTHRDARTIELAPPVGQRPVLVLLTQPTAADPAPAGVHDQLGGVAHLLGTDGAHPVAGDNLPRPVSADELDFELGLGPDHVAEDLARAVGVDLVKTRTDRDRDAVHANQRVASSRCMPVAVVPCHARIGPIDSSRFLLERQLLAAGDFGQSRQELTEAHNRDAGVSTSPGVSQSKSR
jgi:hypothetical protein